MPNYQKSKIYVLFGFKEDGTKLTFYGSTTQNLYKAIYEHARSYKTQKNNTSSKQIIELGNYEILLLEEFPCNNKEELHLRKQFYIKNNDCVNKVIPLRTHIEYVEQNTDKIDLINKKYYEKNKIKLIEKQKIYNEKKKL
jgi:hypothetical protein